MGVMSDSGDETDLPCNLFTKCNKHGEGHSFSVFSLVDAVQNCILIGHSDVATPPNRNKLLTKKLLPPFGNKIPMTI